MENRFANDKSSGIGQCLHRLPHVIPAKAGIKRHWVPACAVMTNAAALDSRLRGNDGMLVPATRLTPGFVLERRWRWERKVRKRFPTQDQFLTPQGQGA